MHRHFQPRIEPHRVTLIAADGYRLGGLHYEPRGAARASLVVAGGVGIAQTHYRRFAQYAAAAGFDTLTVDYRGIGASAPPSLRGFRMNFFDWGRLDLAAAVEVMSPGRTPLFVVGHSYGGHAVGMLPNHHHVRAFYTFGTGAGWHGWMPPAERLRVLAMWHLLGPLLSVGQGCLAWSRLRLGADLPLDFYRAWKRACRYPHYFLGDPATRHLALDFSRVRAPLTAANAIDDRWSPPRSRDAFLPFYSDAPRHTIDLDPAALGLRRLGHMGYFRPSAHLLWRNALDWLASVGSAPVVNERAAPACRTAQRDDEWARTTLAGYAKLTEPAPPLAGIRCCAPPRAAARPASAAASRLHDASPSGCG